MELTLESEFQRFESWKDDFLAKCAKKISEYEESPDLEPWDLLFLADIHELISPENYLGSEIISDGVRRLKDKVAFLYGYLSDICLDGPKFMSLYSQFLECQYAENCSKAIGLWFEQELTDDPEPGSSYYFQGFGASIFVNAMDDVDYASLRSTLPFDQMFVLAPRGQSWSRQDINKAKKHIKNDLAFDGYDCRITSKRVTSDIYYLAFEWQIYDACPDEGAT